MGAAAVDALKKVSDGGGVEKTIAVPITIVTKANVEPYRAVFK
jgi:ribose transport system substrate-binding protein